MRKMHEASSLDSASEVAALRGKTPSTTSFAAREPTPLQLPHESAFLPDSIEKVISRRGSTRQFSREAMTLPQLSLILDRATRGIPADFLDPLGSHLNDLYLIVNNVKAWPPEPTSITGRRRLLEQLKPGDFRDKAGFLGLEQQLPADAAVDVSSSPT